MKKIVLHLILLLSFTSFSQSKTEVRDLLIDKYPSTGSSKSDEIAWIFNEDTIHEFKVPFITNKLKSKLLFKTSFSYIYDIHSGSDDCLIMFDKITKIVIMNSPQQINKDFYRELIGLKLNDEKEIEKFAKELELIIMSGDVIRVIEKTYIKKNLITYEIRLEHQDTLHEIVEVILNNNSVVEIRSLTPKWKNVSVSVK